MNNLQAFHNDAAIKARYIARVNAHALADELIQGTGWETNGVTRGCAIGCTLDAYDHSLYPIELGLPEWLAYLEDAIFEGLPVADAKTWPARFLAAIPVGADVEPVRWQSTKLRMKKLLPALIKNKESYARECESALRGVIALCDRHLAGEFTSAESAAESAAKSAAESAWSAAGSAAGSAAWSAAGSAAGSAAESAWSAARSAWSAARSAAWSAESAAWSTESAAYQWEAETLLTLLAQCKAAT
jgi:hypothetical protein